jgi:hypothetical protein
MTSLNSNPVAAPLTYYVRSQLTNLTEKSLHIHNSRARIDVEGPEPLRVVYKQLRAMVESLNGRAKSRLAYSRFTWQGLRNASMHVCLVLSVVYAVAIVASLTGRPELQ